MLPTNIQAIAIFLIYPARSAPYFYFTPLMFFYQTALHFSAVIGPVENRLPLTRPAGSVALTAVCPKLSDMPAYGTPPPNLTIVLLRDPATHIVAAIPLKPAPGII